LSKCINLGKEPFYQPGNRWPEGRKGLFTANPALEVKITCLVFLANQVGFS
jgi:hypothetical protein